MQARRTREVSIENDIQLLGPLNNPHTVFLGKDKATGQKNFMMKKISFGSDFAQQKQIQEAMLRKLYGNNQLNILKP